jgi:phosphonate transport system substrate-binding protein
LVDLKLLFPPSLGKPKASARAELLEPALCQELGVQVSVEVAPTYGELERRAVAGEVHIVWAPAAVCARLEPTARAIYKVVRHGRSTYRSGLIARAADNLALSVTKLKGLRAAWVDRLSLGGYLLVADHLRTHGIEPDLVFSSQVFLGSHPAALGAVIHGQADVAAITVSGDDLVSGRMALAMHGGPASRGLTVIALSEAAPTDALLLTDKLSLAEAERISEKLFPAGFARARSYLFAVMEADGFERARTNEYKPLLRMLRSADGTTTAPTRVSTPPPFPSSRPPAPNPPSSRPSSQVTSNSSPSRPSSHSSLPALSAPPSRPSSHSSPSTPPPRPSSVLPPAPSRPSNRPPPPPPSSQTSKKPFF